MSGLLWLVGIIEISTAIPYIVDILKGNTKPAIVTWLNWALLAVIAGAASLSAGASSSAIISFAVAAECVFVVIFSLKKGTMVYTRFDAWCQLGALAGLVTWWLTNDPLSGIICFIFIDAIGAIPTLRHAWRKPTEETFYTFGGSIVANLIALLAIPSYTLTSVLIPAYLLVINSTISFEIYYRKQRQKS
jgi:hypothetical protein